jgi:hypothetical protein
MAGSTVFKAELVNVARHENELLGSFSRGDKDLEQRVEFYCETVGIAATAPVKAHYSAVFISWCMRTAGASEADFPAVAGHWQYATWALRNGEKGHGFFQARPVESYAPQLGDIIHVNRDGGIVDFERIRNGPLPYGAESGIVVEIAHGDALIVMGNQGLRGNVGIEKLALAESGMLVQRAKDPFICLIEVLK